MSTPMTPPKPHLWLVGAGPGDPDLLTLKGAKVLAQAQLVLYDSLVHRDILDLAHPNATLICVGKRAGQTSTPQVLIHDWIERGAQQGLRIVRLKGGDPTVFGRAGEELQFAEQLSLGWTYVPGISCGTSLAGLAGIPLTLRGVASSAWLGTATGQDGRLTADLLAALNTSSTLVVFMGRRRIRAIAQHLVQLGKSDTPIAVVSEGSLTQQQCVIPEVVHYQLTPTTTNLRSITPSFTHEYEVPHLPETRKSHVQRLRRV